MRRILLAACLLLGSSMPVLAQAIAGTYVGGDTALTYQMVHSNAQPGKCQCFELAGLGISASWNLNPNLAVVGEFSGTHESDGPGTGNSLSLVSYMAGVRYYLHGPELMMSHNLQPFAQMLVGIAHAGGGIAGAGDGDFAMTGRIGGGIDLPFTPGVAFRIIQVDYYPTEFQNGVNQRQNNILYGAGLVLHWYR